MKALISALLIACVPALGMAQAPAAAAKPTPKTKPGSGKLAPSAQKAVEEVTAIDDDPNVKLSDADLEVAKLVHLGDIKCELGASVKVAAGRRAGMFQVTTKGYRFLMHPVESRTGAIRLEDPRRGAMWLQLGNKSMLMSQKLGQRLADECQSPQQLSYAEELKKNPLPSILEALPKPAPAVPATTTDASAAPAGAPAAADASAPAAPAAPAAAPAAR